MTGASPPAAKIALFRELFRGREDVFPRRWSNPRTGKSGYSPVCGNEWAPGLCGKPKVRCGDCPNRRFLAANFDKENWRADGAAFLATCRDKGVPAAVERSRSGNGGHVWIFFAKPIPAAMARKLGTHLLTVTMERHPEIGFASPSFPAWPPSA